eukprot:5639543-Alexandrium_andersonii.AAC.1
MDCLGGSRQERATPHPEGPRVTSERARLGKRSGRRPEGTRTGSTTHQNTWLPGAADEQVRGV